MQASVYKSKDAVPESMIVSFGQGDEIEALPMEYGGNLLVSESLAGFWESRASVLADENEVHVK